MTPLPIEAVTCDIALRQEVILLPGTEWVVEHWNRPLSPEKPLQSGGLRMGGRSDCQTEPGARQSGATVTRNACGLRMLAGAGATIRVTPIGCITMRTEVGWLERGADDTGLRRSEPSKGAPFGKENAGDLQVGCLETKT